MHADKIIVPPLNFGCFSSYSFHVYLQCGYCFQSSILHFWFPCN